jgi:hypothetical protein
MLPDPRGTPPERLCAVNMTIWEAAARTPRPGLVSPQLSKVRPPRALWLSAGRQTIDEAWRAALERRQPKRFVWALPAGLYVAHKCRITHAAIRSSSLQLA